jgi:glyoxylase I family protein
MPAPFSILGIDHLCLRIAPFDAAAIQAHFAAKGLDRGPEKSRFGAGGQGPSVYLVDPEGNGIELKGPPDLIFAA